MNALRNEIFWKTLKNNRQSIVLFYLPSCKSSLKLYARTSNYIRNFGDKLVRKSYETFSTDTAKYLDMRDVEYDSKIH